MLNSGAVRLEMFIKNDQRFIPNNSIGSDVLMSLPTE